MDYKFYEDLLDNMILHLYGNRITVDEKGIFEWNKSTDGTISYRSVKKLHRFEGPKMEEITNESKGKVIYQTFKNSFYISELTPENTFDIYTTGGGMTKRFSFKKNGSNIVKISEKVIGIR
jgi:hypothetical protein